MSDFFFTVFPLIFFPLFIFVFVFIFVNALRVFALSRRNITEHFSQFKSEQKPSSKSTPPQECRYCRAIIRDPHATHCPSCGAQLPYQQTN